MIVDTAGAFVRARVRITSDCPLEEAVQSALFDWLNCTKYNGLNVGAYAFAVPNGAYLFGTAGQRSAQMARLKRQGLKTGVPDVVIAIPIAPYHGLYVELKREREARPKTSDEQQTWLAKLAGQGYCAKLAYGFDEAQQVVRDYLGIRS